MRSISIGDLPASPIVSGEAIVAKRKTPEECENLPVQENPKWIERADGNEADWNPHAASRSVIPPIADGRAEGEGHDHHARCGEQERGKKYHDMRYGYAIQWTCRKQQAQYLTVEMG
jgi:hypothetical protein